MDVLSQFDIMGPIFGASLAVFAVALGVSQVGSGAMKAMASSEKPETRKEIFSVLVLTSALVEGVALFAIVAGLGVVMNIGTLFG